MTDQRNHIFNERGFGSQFCRLAAAFGAQITSKLEILSEARACAFYAANRNALRSQFVELLIQMNCRHSGNDEYVPNGEIFKPNQPTMGLKALQERIQKKVNNFCKTHAVDDPEQIKTDGSTVFQALYQGNLEAVCDFMEKNHVENPPAVLESKLRKNGDSQALQTPESRHVPFERVANNDTRFKRLFTVTLDVLSAALGKPCSSCRNPLQYSLQAWFNEAERTAGLRKQEICGQLDINGNVLGQTLPGASMQQRRMSVELTTQQPSQRAIRKPSQTARQTSVAGSACELQKVDFKPLPCPDDSPNGSECPSLGMGC